MTEESIQQLAQRVNKDPHALLEQLQAAGVSVNHIEQTILPDQKRQLLLYLRQSHKADSQSQSSPVKLSLKLDRGSIAKGRRRKVNVTIKTKRHFRPTAVTKEPETIGPEIKETTKVNPTDQILETPPKELIVEDTPSSIEKTAELSETKITTLPTKAPEKPSSNNTELTFDLSKASPIEDENHKEKKKNTLGSKNRKAKSCASIDYDIKRHKKKKPSIHRTTISHEFEKPKAPAIYEVDVPESITVLELAKRMSTKAAMVIKALMDMGAMVTINQIIDQETAMLVVEEMGHKAKPSSASAIEDKLSDMTAHQYEALPRPPVVTIMGHVDHGKTSLLDYIRHTKITASEAGNITQHIGAYHVETHRGQITFLDTPGHEAFTAMRARGAQCTDLVILVVACDDGVMPQTIEAIQHAKAAKVPIMVAINKIDKNTADPERIKNELSQHDVIADDWGGEVMFQPISAKTGAGIDDLLDAILLQAEILELKAIAQGPSKGIVLESRLDKGRGVVTSVLVTQGQLKKGDVILAGREFGRVRAMIGDDGSFKKAVGPSMPVEVLGLSGTPSAGDEVISIHDEKKAREISSFRQGKFREIRLARQQSTQLECLFDRMERHKQTLFNIVLKADVQGSVEALSDALNQLSTEEIKVSIISTGVGSITESDVNLAIASNAIMLGFNTRADAQAKQLIERSEINIHYYSIIYHLLNDVKKAMSGLLTPEIQENIVGLATVREVFHSSQFGAIAGCMVTEGELKRHLPIRVLRDHKMIYEGELESLRRFKDDVNEVRIGMECGVGVKNYNDIKPHDQIEVFEKVIVKRTL